MLSLGMRIPCCECDSMAEFVVAFPAVERVILDATERPVQRAKDNEQQKADYSGKKKRHLRSHLALVVSRNKKFASTFTPNLQFTEFGWCPRRRSMVIPLLVAVPLAQAAMRHHSYHPHHTVKTPSSP